MLPSGPLFLLAGNRFGKAAVNEGLGAEQGAMAGLHQVDAELHVFDNVAAAELNRANRLPRKSHARADKMTRQPQSFEPEKPNMIFQDHGKGGNLLAHARVFMRPDKIKRLNRFVGLHGGLRQSIERAVFKLAVGIDDHHNVGRLGVEMPDTEIEGKALAPVAGIIPNDHFSPGSSCNVRRVIGTIIRDNDQTVLWPELRLQGGKCVGNDRCLVVRGHEYGNRWVTFKRERPWFVANERTGNFQTEQQHGPGHGAGRKNESGLYYHWRLNPPKMTRNFPLWTLGTGG